MNSEHISYKSSKKYLKDLHGRALGSSRKGETQKYGLIGRSWILFSSKDRKS